jgi:hypothetical protein
LKGNHRLNQRILVAWNEATRTILQLTVSTGVVLPVRSLVGTADDSLPIYCTRPIAQTGNNFNHDKGENHHHAHISSSLTGDVLSLPLPGFMSGSCVLQPGPIFSKGDMNQMNLSRGTLSFHRLFDTHELGLGTQAHHLTNAVIRQFLKIGEAVAGRWIEMPQGVLILQMVPERPDSGAIYLYDRTQQVFYMLGFEGAEDNLTLEEFKQLLVEYDLLKFAERPGLVQAHQSSQRQPPSQPFPLPVLPKTQFDDTPRPEMSVQGELDLAIQNCVQFTTKQGVRWYARPGSVHLNFQRAGSA